MRKIFTLLLVAVAVNASATEYNTDGTGATVTPASLATVSDSGVSAEGDGVYCFSYDVIVNAADVFSIGDAKEFKLKDGVIITVCGASNFAAPADTRLKVTRATEEDNPGGIIMKNDSTTAAKFENIDFEYAELKNLGSIGFDIDNCTFTLCNGTLSSLAALTLGVTDAEFNITNCTFTDCTVPAIADAANYYCGINIDGCTLTNNNTSNTNKPQINITVGCEHLVSISNCTITGTGLDKVGGIGVSNLMVASGTNKVVITNNEITENRYGIGCTGPMYTEIRGNKLVGNNHESNAMNGGSGISLAGYSYGLSGIISGNYIERSLWGVTLILCDDVNMGQVDNADSPGGNVFKDNANGGTPYDLYNNGTNTVYAQLNTWSVDEQTAENIEEVIYHKTDDSSLGEVIYMPAADPSGIEDVTIEDDAPATWYDLQGRRVIMPKQGIYIRVQGNKAEKVAI